MAVFPFYCVVLIRNINGYYGVVSLVEQKNISSIYYIILVRLLFCRICQILNSFPWIS